MSRVSTCAVAHLRKQAATSSHLRHTLTGESSYNLPGPSYPGVTGYGAIQGSISVWHLVTEPTPWISSGLYLLQAVIKIMNKKLNYLAYGEVGQIYVCFSMISRALENT